MENIEDRIKSIVNKNIQEPMKYDLTIKKALDKDKIKNYRHKQILHTIISSIIGIFMTVGVVFASTTMYEKVWIEPKKYESYEEFKTDYINSIKDNLVVTQEDKEEAVNEEQASEKALEFLKQIGYENEKVVSTKLTKNEVLEDELLYTIKTNKDANSGFYITMNAKNGKVQGFMNSDLGKVQIEADTLTEDEAKEYVEKIYNLFNLRPGEYKLKEIKEVPFCYNSIPTRFWNVTYCKIYDGAFNRFERFEIAFLVKNGKMQIHQVGITNENVGFENNPIEISKDEAIEIAKEQNSKITDNKIVYTAAVIQIREMNAFVYEQEQSAGVNTNLNKEIQEDGTELSYPQYAILENKARKVWAVKFDFEIGEVDPNNEYKYWSRLYFVDTTTGEVIGGSWGRRGDDMT